MGEDESGPWSISLCVIDRGGSAAPVMLQMCVKQQLAAVKKATFK